MFKKIILFLIIPFIFSACSDNSKIAPKNTKNIVTAQSDNVTSVAEIKTQPDSTTTYTNTSITDRKISKLPDYMGNFTLQNPVSPWTEEDVSTAWNMLEWSKNYERYFDRLFCDLDNDGTQELILTVGESAMKMYIFEKNENEITLKWAAEQNSWDFPYYEKDIGKGEVCTPITDKETLSSYIDEFDLYAVLERDFKIIDADGKHYMTGFVHNAYATELPGNIFWIKEISIENGELCFNTLYRWGIFFEIEPDGFHNYIHYYKCAGDSIEEYTEVSAEEIEEFLKNIQIVL